MAEKAQTYDKTRNANAAGEGALSGSLSGFATGAGIGAAAAGAATGGLGVIPGALIGGLIGAATVGAGSAGANAWTDDAAQKQEIKTSEKNIASAMQAEKDATIDTAAMQRAAQKPGGSNAPGLPSAASYFGSGGGTGYDSWKAQLRSGY